MAWFFIGLPLLRCSLVPFSGLRVWLLKLFGAEVGQGVVVKPGVRVKFPWHLRIGNESYMLSADGYLMPAKKGQPAPDMKYFNASRK